MGSFLAATKTRHPVAGRPATWKYEVLAGAPVLAVRAALQPAGRPAPGPQCFRPVMSPGLLRGGVDPLDLYEIIGDPGCDF